jgi:outer membrane lipoprotein-sorting protein
MNRILVSTLSLLLTVYAVAQAESPAPPMEWPKQYSADLEMTSQANAGVKTTTKIFVDGSLTRTEMNVNGMQNVTIMLSDKKVMYTLMPAQKMYMEMQMSDTLAPAPVDDTTRWEALGSEMINGKDCLKYRATATAGGHATSMIYWVSKADKLPVRMATEDGQMTTDWSNFTKGAQDPALFNVPTDFKKMSMPSSMTMPGSVTPTTSYPRGQ